jgi:hypothetical protein
VIWVRLDPHVDLGFLPELLDENDPRSVKEQLEDKYRYGGGWRPLDGFRLGENYALKYPNDPPMKPIASAKLRDELILLYPYSFLLVKQPDNSFEVARVD